MSIASGLPVAYLDQVVLAIYDLLHQDPELRERFGGRVLAGTASIAADATSLVGTGTSWATGDDSLSPADYLVLGDQVAEIESVSSDTALEIVPPVGPSVSPGHADGLTDATIHKAARGFRVNFAHQPVIVSMPYWTVAPGLQPAFERGIGRLQSAPAAQVTMVYEEGASSNILRQGEPSWAALTLRAVGTLSADANAIKLCVPRFASGPGLNLVPLVTTLETIGEELIEVAGPSRNIAAPSVPLTYRGRDPKRTSTDLPARW